MDDQVFPRERTSSADPRSPGLTKRELFAAMAMQGILSCPETDSNALPASIAYCAVRDADALLAELEKTS